MKKYLSLFLVLGVVGCQSRPVPADLLANDPVVREAAFAKLHKLRPSKRASLIEPLVNALRDPETQVVARAEEALVIVGPQTVPALQSNLKHSDAYVRLCAVSLIGKFGLDAKAAIPDLTVALKDPHPLVREEATLALSKMGPEAKDAVPELALLLLDESKDVSAGAHDALSKIGTPEAQEALKNFKPKKPVKTAKAPPKKKK